MAELRPELSFCIVNTEQRALLLRGLDAVAAERARLAVPSEVVVLDNASGDGSAAAARAHPAVDVVVERDRRAGVSENVNAVLARSRGRFALLLNEDAELRPGAAEALLTALQADPRAGAAAAALFRPDGRAQPSAWRFPSPATALVGAVFLHRWWTVQSGGTATREVDWAQSSALLVRREAVEAVGGLDEAFFVYSDEVDLEKRMRGRGWRILHVPAAEAIHHEQLSTGSVPGRRIVELSRNRDRYMRKHHGALTAWTVRLLTAWTYALRALAAVVLPGHDPRRYLRHVTATLLPSRGEGIREAAEAYNRASGSGTGDLGGAGPAQAVAEAAGGRELPGTEEARRPQARDDRGEES